MSDAVIGPEGGKPTVDALKEPGADFERTAEALAGCISRFGFYFGEDKIKIDPETKTPRPTGQNRGEWIMERLQAARDQYLSDSLDETVRIPIFWGVESRDLRHEELSDNNRVLEGLFDSMAALTGANIPDGYYSIKNKAVEHSAYGNIVDRPLMGYPDFMAKPVSALRSYKGELEGVVLRLGEGIYATFALGNFEGPGEPGDPASTVSLYVVPSQK